MVQKPHAFFQEALAPSINLPGFNEYGVAMIFFPHHEDRKEACRAIFNKVMDELGLKLLGYRKVPTNNQSLGRASLSVEHSVEQAFITFKEPVSDDPMVLER